MHYKSTEVFNVIKTIKTENEKQFSCGWLQRLIGKSEKKKVLAFCSKSHKVLMPCEIKFTIYW
jgi:predicted RNA-binding protein